MLAIFVYAIGIMYSPGPVNLMGLHSGLHRQTKSHFGFFVGVGCAMFILFVLLSYAGLKVIDNQWLPYISLVGCIYILYIACKIGREKVEIYADNKRKATLSFKEGLFIQLLNPKGMIATLPIATIQFPNAGIEGSTMVFWSFILALLAFGAPAGYSLLGSFLGAKIQSGWMFKIFNTIMALLLVYVAISIGYDYGYRPLFLM